MTKKIENIKPEFLDDIIGHQNIIKLLKNIVEQSANNSFIFYGESGIGKTSLATALANESNKKWTLYNATIENKNDLITKLENNQIVIIDEIHRLNKDKQEILLSYVENNLVTIYATTTENPFFKIVPSLRSRLKIIKLNPLDEQEVLLGIKKLFLKNDIELNIDDKLLLSLIKKSNKDIRNIFINLNLISLLYKKEKITIEAIENILPDLNYFSDEAGDSHYNLLSAFHKSLRGSDPNASLYYGFILAKNGDLESLFRRMIMVSYEDIGLASANISLKVDTAIRNIERVGFPEANIILANIIVELALSPKSNSTTLAAAKVQSLIEEGNIFDMPNHLKDSHYRSASKLGHGLNYKYAHDYPDSWVEQDYLPKELKEVIFFEYGSSQNENKYKELWIKIKNKKIK